MTNPNRENLNSVESGADAARQLLELELQKIRSQASAARLDARAAEIEMIIQRLRANQSSDELASLELKDQRLRVDAESSSVADLSTNVAEVSASMPAHRFSSWNEVRSVQVATGAVGEIATGSQRLSESTSDQESILRFDGPHGNVNPLGDAPSENAIPSHHLPLDQGVQESDADAPTLDADFEDEDSEAMADETRSFLSTDEVPLPLLDHESIEFAERLSKNWNVDQESKPRRRFKSAAMLASGIIHIGVMLFLGEVALQIHSPKDQVALTASASSGEEMAMESFSIENVDEPEPEMEVTEPTPVETEYEVSPIGEFKAADFSTDAIASPVSSLAAAMTSQSDPNVTAMMLEPDSVSKMKFCGVEGGGNHFVYLVDSSGSMGDAFESARRELLASIDLLSPDQRFYVVFFDSKPDFMQITKPGVDEARSVYATAKNKAALRRWAMQISMDRGKAPYDPLKFALGLRADVIFLLSDGEFPEGIPTLLKEENRVENLFGETKPISIVHTISYFSKEGASIMTRIAKQNSGQYRHVPKP